MPTGDSSGPSLEPSAAEYAHGGHFQSSHPAISAAVLAEIREIQRQNYTNLGDGRELRTRRDDVLTSAAGLVARLVRDGVHLCPDALCALARAATAAAVDGRSLREPLTLVARLVVGPGRNRNTYAAVGRAGAYAAAHRANDAEAAIRAAGGVSGAAARHATAERGPGRENEPRPPSARPVPVRLAAHADALGMLPPDDTPRHAVLRRSADGTVELILVAGEGYARVAVRGDDRGLMRALRPVRSGMVAGVRVALVPCTLEVCDAIGRGGASVLAVAADPSARRLVEGLAEVSTEPESPRRRRGKPKRSGPSASDQLALLRG